jgi:diguanylate cyclase (GGDEF)-like protein
MYDIVDRDSGDSKAGILSIEYSESNIVFEGWVMSAIMSIGIQNIIDQLEYAFQPLVNIHTGACYGYEALLRHVDRLGFEDIGAFFDHFFISGQLFEVERCLREKAIARFANLQVDRRYKLFYNLDNRLFDNGVDLGEETYRILQKYGLSWEHICFEVSEKQELTDVDHLKQYQVIFRTRKAKIAIDDCGTGFSGLQLLYHLEPNLIKIDRFFIQDIAIDAKKRLFVATIVNLAHLMGSLVVAEGVETEKEYYSCRDIGCDLVQGYLVQKPMLDLSALDVSYDYIHLLSTRDRRTKEDHDRKLIDSELEKLRPVSNAERVVDVFENFRTSQKGLLPVINQAREPIGVIRESVFKDYAYSRYGRELLEKASRYQPLEDFMTWFPMAEVHTPIEKILEIYTLNETIEGIIITDNLEYIGFLSAQSLLKVINDKNLAVARDLNPLTKLPGNTLIHEYVSKAVRDLETQYHLVYYDFNNFKPYNDKYGFRQGDRALHLFAQILTRKANASNCFIGHIGGDDFFLAVRGETLESVKTQAADIVETFRRDVESFYEQETIERGYIESKDRDGNPRRYPLLSVCAALVTLPPQRTRLFSPDDVSQIIALLKKRAKQCASGLCCLNLALIENRPTVGFDFLDAYLTS